MSFIIIDYLQLMNASGMKFGSREPGINDFALAQAVGQSSTSPSWHSRSSTVRSSRAVPTRTTASVRSSPTFVNQGSYRQDADIVCFIHRPEYYLRRASTELAATYAAWPSLSWPSTVQDDVDDVKVRFKSKYARFENWEERPR